MGLTYFKRYRMEADLTLPAPELPALPAGYHVAGWHRALLSAHAQAKFASFRSEIDANVFPCFGEYEGCLRLMDDISRREGFLPQATWLVTYSPPAGRPTEFCGTVQGIVDVQRYGAIQNLGVVPEHRGLQLGTYLLLRALEGFRELGLRRTFLEVTAANTAAIRLYERLGFSRVRTLYKAVDAPLYAGL